jgi:hypothetical protein
VRLGGVKNVWPSHLVFCLGFLVLIACNDTAGQAPPDGGQTGDGGQTTDGPAQPDAPTPITGACEPSHLGGNDGCDCGCGVTDSDCASPLTVGACQYDNCPAGTMLDPAAPTQCKAIVVPSGWTCGASSYGDGICQCGCGTVDPDCPSPVTVASCGSTNGCSTGSWPDPANLSTCVTKPAGWTCSLQDYADTTCSCGCGIPDPSCPTAPHISQCLDDGCPSGQSPNPTQPTQCMANAPQDRWTCDLALLADGATCDCGCGAIDPDCGASPTAAACEATHCGTTDELVPGNIGACWERCHATPPANSGTATCTNGGSISFGSLACGRDVSACSDGHRYEIECEGGTCSCRIDGQCVGHASTTVCSLSACGWNVTGPN